MMEKWQISHGEFQTKAENRNFALYKCDLHIVSFFPEITVWQEGKKSNFTVQKCDKYCLSQVISVSINDDQSCWEYKHIHEMIWWNWTLPLLFFSPKSTATVWSWEKPATNSSGGSFCHIPDKYCSKIEMLKQKQTKKKKKRKKKRKNL